MNLIRLYTIIFFFISVIGYTQTLAKFEPTDGSCLVFIGQDLEATGGLDAYTNGYTNFFDTPVGVTIYTNISPSDESFGYYNRGLDGIETKANWGAGDACAQYYLEDTTYKNTIISIGLSIVNHEKKVGNGQHDAYIIRLGNWIRESKRPVFLRIGYEFDGHDWNHYNRKHYLKAWERIYNIFRKIRVDNVAFVWQSKGTGSNQEALEKWYPGDDVVDWCAYSYFGNPDTEMLTFARKHNKPVFIAEASPTLQIDNLFFDTDLKKDIIAKRAWQQWFIPFFKTLNDNKDVIKAFSYINTNWSEQTMWKMNPVFQKVDSRIQVSPFISEKWKAEMAKSRYLKASDSLWEKLHGYTFKK
ncbi:1,4-beta-xylanase [uncultured Dokdonia sp.]|uniref:1,4-beta-xylanase n=1 Tax=uncultured Dokdonia sp. TaxID=575653 RepID=UPI002614FEA2|nr:1,4-beta-xylanase [uncultured Dokdonia sp.]